MTNEHLDVRQISLVFYEEEHQEALELFYLTDEQLQFTASPKAALDVAKSDKQRFPVVILSENVPVGFFVLHVGENIQPFTRNPNAILLRALSVNYEHQGNGYGKQVLRLLPSFVAMHFGEINEIVLAVNETNPIAKRLYEKMGYVDKGFRKEFDKGDQIILHYAVHA
ncbi:GNAT family N-acetyltransferase [Paenibacillus sp. SYP-B3998]|uniref:GNAT family N-acetyltransferase n=1 Tax=Paenibacillus sp. SYP-B3998 TaxID=2678564 RepID=A0A6G3ZWJ0_9BACL|nr:GNAT family N-acetyltransferase [Paenibacillus sp. SYP-B3998]NEW06586.1 GNAT family N-acetyltransferase [Paenibacillus sp. SYP-B3998]